MSAAAKPLPSSEKSLTRREFLYYIGGASLALITAGTCGGVLWYTLPDNRVGEIAVDMTQFNRFIRHPIFATLYIRDAQVHLVRFDNAILMFDSHCPDDDIIIRWVDTNNRFECPRCGSKYTLEGRAIDGPTPRDLDRFAFRVTTSDGTVLTSNDSSPIDVHDAVEIIIDTHAKILGADRA
jgi:cytochrome b6-f complex iron-sulfur subunit